MQFRIFPKLGHSNIRDFIFCYIDTYNLTQFFGNVLTTFMSIIKSLLVNPFLAIPPFLLKREIWAIWKDNMYLSNWTIKASGQEGQKIAKRYQNNRRRNITDLCSVWDTIIYHCWHVNNPCPRSNKQGLHKGVLV